MPYLVGGYPDTKRSIAVAKTYVESGADLVEIGIPFSDPLADGPVIQTAASDALASGIDTAAVMDVAASISEEVPVVLLAYAGIVLGGEGPSAFADQAVAAGVSGVVIPDLPLGTDESVRETLSEAGLAVIPLVAPTTSPDRRSQILAVAAGFVYVVSDVGTTGERDSLPPDLAGMVATVSAEASVPVAVGFGIGSPEKAAEVGQIAEGVIIGSKLVSMVDGGGAEDEQLARISDFLTSTVTAMAKAGRDGLR